MTNLDHGKFTRATTIFHSLLALDVFALFFSGYAVMFNDELWWLVEFMGGNTGVLAVHRVAGFVLIALAIYWITLMITTSTGRGNFRTVMPDLKNDTAAFIQDIRFALGRTDERHPHARQFAGYEADEVPLISYVGKGVIWIFTVEIILLSASGILIWSKTGIVDGIFQTKAAAMAFVVFHGLLGVIMLMGVMFHIFEHGFHPAFYPVELKAFIPRDMIPEEHAGGGRGTGIERLELSRSWQWAANLFGAVTVIGIVSVLVGSLFDEGYPIPRELAVGGGPTNLALTIGINLGILVLFVGLVLSLYGNVLRARWERQVREGEREPAPAADGGQQADD